LACQPEINAPSGVDLVAVVMFSALALLAGAFLPNEVSVVMVEKRTDTPEKPIVVSKTEARQAIHVWGMLPVLVIGTVGAFVALAGLYIYYFGWPFWAAMNSLNAVGKSRKARSVGSLLALEAENCDTFMGAALMNKWDERLAARSRGRG
jgi:hypothetical protein